MPARKIVCLSTSPFPYGNNITDGPGYRAWNLLNEVANENEVVILSLYESFHQGSLSKTDILEGRILVKCIHHQPSAVAKAISKQAPDVLYLPWSASPFTSRLKTKIPTIIDHVGPGLLESYVSQGFVPSYLLQIQLNSFWLGDFFMTAGSRERYYLLGLMLASKRLSVGKHCPNDRVIHYIPMTPPSEPAKKKKEVIDRRAGDFVILLAGAFLSWYDYPTLLRAAKTLKDLGKTDFRLIFMGANPKSVSTEISVKQMVNSYGLRDEVIFTGAVPFKERADFYLSSDVAVNIGPDTLENELSVRTRVIDCIWGGLPLVTTAMDEYSKMAIEHGAGFAYEAGDSTGLCRLLQRLMDKPELLDEARDKSEMLLHEQFNVKKVIAPVKAFIEKPYLTPGRTFGWPGRARPEIMIWARDILRFFQLQ